MVFRELRAALGMRQAEFATRLGFEQSYVSAIEVGAKGPPNKDFVARLVKTLDLGELWENKLNAALDESQRKIMLSAESTEATFKMFNELRRQIDRLHPAQVELMQMALKLPSALNTDELRSLQKKTQKRDQTGHDQADPGIRSTE